MLWIKRNLFLAVTGLVALLLLGGGVFFVMGGRSRNAALDEEVEATRSKLNSIYGKDPFPHTTNISTARKEIGRLRSEAQKLTKHFSPVPVERVETRDFLTLRDRTLSELRDAAQKAGVGLPPSSSPSPYAFSFDVQRAKNSFGPGTFPVVPQQLMEVKQLCAALYEARVTRLLNIRRARASADDNATGAPVQDYTPGVGIITNAAAAVHPYEVTFTCFSAELGQVLSALARSPHGFVVKAVQVEPESLQLADAGGVLPPPGAEPGLMAGQPAPPRFVGGRQPPPGRGVPPPARPGVVAPAVAPPRPGPGSDRPVVLLKERRLRVTLLVYAIKPAK